MNDTADLLAICRRLIDPAASAIEHHGGHNNTVALRAATARGDVVIKVHRSQERHDQEVHAYRHWTASCADRVPRLLATNDNPAAIVVTAIDGQPLAAAAPPPHQERNAYHQAGQLLHAFHHAGPPRGEPNMTAWLAERGEHWLTAARDLLPRTRLATIRAHLRDLADLGPIPAVPCHLDYTPRNLLFNGDHLHVIDFEHSRYDLAARDLVRLHARVFPYRADLKAAFHDGYSPLSSLDERVIEHCHHLDSLTHAVRAAGRPAPFSQRPTAK